MRLAFSREPLEAGADHPGRTDAPLRRCGLPGTPTSEGSRLASLGICILSVPQGGRIQPTRDSRDFKRLPRESA